jgi:hypothetical protein
VDTARLQLQHAHHFMNSMEHLYPGRDFSHVLKYHMMGHHTHPTGAVAGHLERINSQIFELANRVQKHVAANSTNRKDIDQQLLKREREAMAAQHAKWTFQAESADDLHSDSEQLDDDANDSDWGHGAMQFPIHELIERVPSPSFPSPLA